MFYFKYLNLCNLLMVQIEQKSIGSLLARCHQVVEEANVVNKVCLIELFAGCILLGLALSYMSYIFHNIEIPGFDKSCFTVINKILFLG